MTADAAGGATRGSVRDVQVLLSTYNGARFLEEQLASLRDQTVAARMRVLVRDDGSTDDTVGLLTRFEPGPLVVDVVAGANVGVVASFAQLLREADRSCSVFLICDQDDVWLPDKVERAVDAVLAQPDDVPVLYCGRSTIVDERLRPLGVTDPAPKGPSFVNGLMHNISPGHTMAMNRAMLDEGAATLRPAEVFMYDWWLYALACAVGRVIVDETPHALYRMHGHNELGYLTTPWQRFWGGVHRVLTLDRSVWSRQAYALWDAVGPRLNPADREALLAFLDQHSLASRLSFLRRHGLVYQTKDFPFVASLLFALGRYRDKDRTGVPDSRA